MEGDTRHMIGDEMSFFWVMGGGISHIVCTFEGFSIIRMQVFLFVFLVYLTRCLVCIIHFADQLSPITLRKPKLVFIKLFEFLKL